MNKMENISFQMIASAGSATSLYMEAVEEAKEGNIEKAYDLISKGEKFYHESHKVHAEIIKDMANGEGIEIDLLFMHAEDQLMNAEVIKIMAVQNIETLERITELEKRFK